MLNFGRTCQSQHPKGKRFRGATAVLDVQANGNDGDVRAHAAAFVPDEKKNSHARVSFLASYSPTRELLVAVGLVTYLPSTDEAI